MPLSVRLDKQLMQKLASIAKANGLSKSELVRQCLAEYLAGADRPTAWELGKHLFGCFHSRKGDLSVRAKDIAIERMHARRIKTNRR